MLLIKNPLWLWASIPFFLLWIWSAWKSRSFKPFLFPVLGALSICVALARPQWGKKEVHHSTKQIPLFFVMDISKSMLAEDILPSRLQFSISAAKLLIEKLPQARIGLFTFAGDGYLRLPLTTDRNVIEQVLSSLRPEDTTYLGSDLGLSLESFWKVLHKRGLISEATPLQLILFSDGESHGSWNTSVLKPFRANGIPIHTIGVGTPAGNTIPDRLGRPLKDKDQVVITKLNKENLKEISRLTGGEYFSAQLGSMEQLASHLSRTQGTQWGTQSLKVDQEFYHWFLAFSLIVFFIYLLKSRWEYAFKSILFLFVLSSYSFAVTVEELKIQIEEEKDPELQSLLQYNLGVQWEQKGDLKEAMVSYQNSFSARAPIQKKSLFNLGNIYLKTGRPDLALEAYQRALDIGAEDHSWKNSDTQKIYENIVLAHKILKALQQQKSKDGNGKQNQPPQDPKGPQRDYEANLFNPDRKQRIYDLLASKEQETLQRLQRKAGEKVAPLHGRTW